MSDLEEMCHIDKGTYTDGPVLTNDIRNLFDRIAELEAQLSARDAENARLREALKNAAVACRNLEHDERFTAESIAKGCEKALGAAMIVKTSGN